MNQFDETFDYVVVGSGAGAMCAALVMAEAGKSTLILEKTAVLGGTTARSGGAMWIPNNRYMKRDGINDNTEKAMAYLDELIGSDPTAPAASRQRRLKFVTEAPRMIDFIADRGVRLTRTDYWPDYYDNRPGGSVDSRSVFSEVFDAKELGPWADKLRPGFIPMPVNLAEILPLPKSVKAKIGRGMTVMLGSMHLGQMMKLPHFRKSWVGRKMMLKVGLAWLFGRLTGKHYVAAGAGLQGQLLKAALNAGADLRVGSPVMGLIEHDGRITGVATESGGISRRIGATLGVLVNAGGFAHNQAMRDQYAPGTRVEWTSAAEGDTGEMLQEMMRHGAAVAQMDARVGNQTTPMPGFENMPIKPSMQSVTAKPHCILVDQTGVRYQTEGGSYSAYCQGMLERNRTVPAVPSWAIFDERLLRNYIFGGGMPGEGLGRSGVWIEAGYMKKGGSIEELSVHLDIDPAILRATVDRFNAFVDKGVDEDFHRGQSAYDGWLGDPFREPSKSLGRIDQGPFYAVPILPGDMGTYGGVVTDIHARVLREDGSVIEGLYATGVSTAGVMGRSYPGGGASVGPSMTFGYVAARHAAGLEIPDN
ncbi:MAG: FAD-dependent oxidoreductase [Halioglobus sp.]|nr:FAD-dependent oxidoreductase [Halioglobus sp.]